MATIDTMLAEAEVVTVSNEVLLIDPNTRQINIPGNELVFGVEADGRAERKYFQCPRFVGNNIDLSTSFIRVNFRNDNGDIDFTLIKDVAVTADGENVTFSWELPPAATRYQGQVRFVVCAVSADLEHKWNTTQATGIVLIGMQPDTGVVEDAAKDGIAQLLITVEQQTQAVKDEGAAQIEAVRAASEAAEALSVAEIEAKGVNTLDSIPDDYTELSGAVEELDMSRAPGIVCSAEGETVNITDASSLKVQCIKIMGKSTQDSTPTPENPVEIVGIENPTLSIDGQTILVSKTLHGVPVTSDGNYTDSDGQQWICDEVDLVRGVYVQRIGQVLFDGSSDEVILDNVTKDQTVVFEVHLPLSVESVNADNYISNRFTPSANSGDVEKIKLIGIGMYVAINKSRLSEMSVGGFRKWLAINNLDIRYVMDEPIEIPLSETEIAAYRAIHTSYPNTTVFTDKGAHVRVAYIADTKLYIDRILTQGGD